MNRKLNWFAGLMAFSAITAQAVCADEAKTLGTTLTPIGAEKAANAAGTIPAYTGGLTAAPAGFKAGDGIRPDPLPPRSRACRSTPRTWRPMRRS